MRFIAALVVVAYHYADDAPVPLGEISPIFGSAWVATDFFLMLSGYVLARAYGSRIEAGVVGAVEFLKRRLIKIWPAHAIMMLVLAAIVETARLSHISGGHSQGYDWAYFPAEFFLVQSWGLGVPPGWNMPTWSLSALVVCYAAFPFVWKRLAAAGRLTALAVGLGVLFGSAALAAAAGLRLADLPLDVGVLRALPLFVLGAALARLGPVREAFAGKSGLAGLAAAVSAGVVASLVDPTLGVLLLIAAGVAVIGPITPARAWPLAEKAAAISFPLFITHFVSGELYMRLGHKVLPYLPDSPLTAWALWFGAFGFAVLVALAFARFVDRPVQAAIKGWMERRRARRALEPATA